MPQNYFHMTRSTVKNQKPGMKNLAHIAPLGWFSLLQEPTPGVGGLINIEINTDHTFATTPTGAGFVKLYSLPKMAESSAESNGEVGALNMVYKGKLFMPGDSKEMQVMLEQLKNDDCIILMEDTECPLGSVYQFGCDCAPAYVTSAKFQSGKRGDGTKGWEIEFESSCRFFYTGTITLATT